MKEILEQVANGELSVPEAEAQLQGYTISDAGRYDVARETRSGIPEAILGSGKSPSEVAELVTSAVQTAGRAIVTRISDDQYEMSINRLNSEYPDVDIDYHKRANILVVKSPSFETHHIDATIGVISAGTGDIVPASEAAVIADEMGVTVEQIDDVGVASIARILDQVDRLRQMDVVIVAAGREGSLPTIVAGMIDTPVIGLPVSTGYGHAGDGEAALKGMLQSCTVLSVVNIDAGFVAGAQAGLISQSIADH